MVCCFALSHVLVLALLQVRGEALSHVLFLRYRTWSAASRKTAGAPAVLVVSAAEPDQRGRLQRRRGGRRLFVRDVRGGVYRHHGGVVAPSLCAAAANIGAAMMPRPPSPRRRFGKLNL
jgi:hypothetical protein